MSRPKVYRIIERAERFVVQDCAGPDNDWQDCVTGYLPAETIEEADGIKQECMARDESQPFKVVG